MPMSNFEAQQRQTALAQAVNNSRAGDTDEDVVKRAEVFYEFLKGDSQ